MTRRVPMIPLPPLTWQTFRTSPLTVFDKFDRHCSGYLHRMNLGLIDYLLVIPGVACSQHCVPGIIILLYLAESLTLGVFTTVSSVLTVLVTEIVKKRTKRDRPDFELINNRQMNLRALLTNFSFPSGDSAQSAVLGLSLFFYTKHNNYPMSDAYLLVMPVVMFARVYFGCHWISDVLIGASIGGVVTTVMHTLWTHYLHFPFWPHDT